MVDVWVNWSTRLPARRPAGSANRWARVGDDRNSTSTSRARRALPPGVAKGAAWHNAPLSR